MYPMKPVPLTFEINEGEIVERHADGSSFFGSDQYTIEYAVIASELAGSRIHWLCGDKLRKSVSYTVFTNYHLRGIFRPSYHDKHGRCGRHSGKAAKGRCVD